MTAKISIEDLASKFRHRAAQLRAASEKKRRTTHLSNTSSGGSGHSRQKSPETGHKT
ncbi:MAG: hypothetical protein IPJ82_11490 [Lewinellaceae bacterium]|nr:hypothetical protein [Lewinellaceae bacterium]